MGPDRDSRWQRFQRMIGDLTGVPPALLVYFATDYFSGRFEIALPSAVAVAVVPPTGRRLTRCVSQVRSRCALDSTFKYLADESPGALTAKPRVKFVMPEGLLRQAGDVWEVPWGRDPPHEYMNFCQALVSEEFLPFVYSSFDTTSLIAVRSVVEGQFCRDHSATTKERYEAERVARPHDEAQQEYRTLETMRQHGRFFPIVGRALAKSQERLQAGIGMDGFEEELSSFLQWAKPLALNQTWGEVTPERRLKDQHPGHYFKMALDRFIVRDDFPQSGGKRLVKSLTYYREAGFKEVGLFSIAQSLGSITWLTEALGQVVQGLGVVAYHTKRVPVAKLHGGVPLCYVIRFH